MSADAEEIAELRRLRKEDPAAVVRRCKDRALALARRARKKGDDAVADEIEARIRRAEEGRHGR